MRLTVRALRGMSLGELYLLISCVGALAMAGVLLLLPPRLTTGPSLATVFSIADRHTWGALFAVLAALCSAGFWRPTETRFIVVFTLVVFVQTLWAVGLTLPAAEPNATANLLAPIAWLQLSGVGIMVGVATRRPVLPHP